ncbi:MAG: peroxide stress protein YaaA [Ekhidna sp.]|nr:peroxide stress protein YaaA [Ekhidna sp.]MBC6411390.1 peroxide stress protein YaaA [Ekhidna sp.]MBC6425277.1 peroxide stress protein YaaA [Ekhidna sp.]
MIAVVSPAKSLDFESEINFKGTQPRLMECTNVLIEVMRKKSAHEVSELMSISKQLAELNIYRYKQFDATHTNANARPSVFAFNGDVYRGLKAETFDEQKMAFAGKHLRILSGLYGLLRPLDLIQPYRLEMGTKLAFDDYKTLYEYWGHKIRNLLLEDLKEQGDDIIVNLASNEYFRSIAGGDIPARIVNVEFRDFKGGKYKIISFHAKKARGLMSRYIIENQVSSPEDLRGFDYEGYYFDTEASSENLYAFKRERE